MNPTSHLVRSLAGHIKSVLACCAVMLATSVYSQSDNLAQGKILRIRDLAVTNPLVGAPASSGDVQGVERSGRTSAPDSPIRAHIMLIQGIGWTQRYAAYASNLRLVRAIEKMYGAADSLMTVTRLCPDSETQGPRPAVGGIKFYSPDRKQWVLRTDDPRLPVLVTHLVCLDRIVISIPHDGQIIVYRLQWDDLLYDSVQYPHIGYDDDIRSADEAGHLAYAGHAAVQGYEDINALRKADNAALKNQLVSYGLSEAAMYLGQQGELLRQNLAGAMCAVLHQIAGTDKPLDEHDRLHEATPVNEALKFERPAQTYCDKPIQAAGPTQAHANVTLITESLGSRVVFDLLSRNGNPQLQARMLEAGIDKPEVFMLANQIPMLAPARLRPFEPLELAPRTFKPKLIALSEINDPLTFELVPYFEHQYVRRCTPLPAGFPERSATLCEDGPEAAPLARLARLNANQALRRQLTDDIGFDVIDVRLAFAQPYSRWFSLGDFVDPMQAHTAHLSVDVVRRLLLCGAESGRVRDHQNGCGIRH